MSMALICAWANQPLLVGRSEGTSASRTYMNPMPAVPRRYLSIPPTAKSTSQAFTSMSKEPTD